MPERLTSHICQTLRNLRIRSSSDVEEKDESVLLAKEIKRLQNKEQVTGLLNKITTVLKEDDPLAIVIENNIGEKDDIRMQLGHLDTKYPKMTFNAVVAILAQEYAEDVDLQTNWINSAAETEIQNERLLFTVLRIPLVGNVGIEMNTMSNRSSLSLVELPTETPKSN